MWGVQPCASFSSVESQGYAAARGLGILHHLAQCRASRKWVFGRSSRVARYALSYENVGRLAQLILQHVWVPPTHWPTLPCAQVLETHQDEVWHVQFSHSGTMLASASKDATSLIWRVSPAGEALLMHTLTGHSKPVVFLTWSPDDCRLLTCCSNQEARAPLPGRCRALLACCS